jgi:hypothetical protein
VRTIGLKVPPLQYNSSFGSVYADLTTFLLARKISVLIPKGKIGRVHEVGVGMYGLLALHVKKRFPHVDVSASTIEPQEIESVRAIAAENAIQLDLSLSDVLAEIDGPIGLVWWNLPYYQADVVDCIDRLCAQVHDRLALQPGGLMLLGFNEVPLPASRVIAIIERYPYLRLASKERFFWNPHCLLTIEYKPRAD